MVQDISKFDKCFIKSYNERSHKGHFLEVDIQYTEKSYELHNDLSFFSERMKIEKVEKLVANKHDKVEYVRNLKQA